MHMIGKDTSRGTSPFRACVASAKRGSSKTFPMRVYLRFKGCLWCSRVTGEFALQGSMSPLPVERWGLQARSSSPKGSTSDPPVSHTTRSSQTSQPRACILSSGSTQMTVIRRTVCPWSRGHAAGREGRWQLAGPACWSRKECRPAFHL